MNTFISLSSHRLYSKEITCVATDDIFALFTSQQLLAYTDIKPISHISEIDSIYTYISSLHKSYVFLYEKESDLCVGLVMVGIVSKHRTASLTVVILPQFQNRKYMQEAVTSVASYLFTSTTVFRIEAQVFCNNNASIKALENIGFTNEGILRKNFMIQGKLEDSIMFSLLQSDMS